MKKPGVIIFGLIFAIVSLTLTRAVVSNSLSTSGVDLSRIDQEIDTYRRESVLLNEKILQASAYTTLEEDAERKGYTQMSGQIVLSAPVPMAAKL